MVFQYFLGDLLPVKASAISTAQNHHLEVSSSHTARTGILSKKRMDVLIIFTSLRKSFLECNYHIYYSTFSHFLQAVYTKFCSLHCNTAPLPTNSKILVCHEALDGRTGQLSTSCFMFRQKFEPTLLLLTRSITGRKRGSLAVASFSFSRIRWEFFAIHHQNPSIY